jgi:serine/threonine protein kinase
MSPESAIAHYRITGKLGEGGMGAVYRAADTKLGRDVAIKVLPDAFGGDPDRMARFAREAQVLASLNHPNIAAIYGVEDRALVMELVEGPTLDERIAQGPVNAEEALPLILELIDALEYAHDRGVVHRDLKPANIKLGSRLKVLDFGLAKALSSDAPRTDPANSPTLTMHATMAGVIMGTAGYMAPEQARGHDVDRKADIWSFGVVVFEMLTGRQLFEGPTVSDTLAAVLTREPPIDEVPPRFRRLLRLCLTRDARQRLSHISAARILLDEAPAAAVPLRTAPSRLPWILAVASSCIALAIGAAWLLGPATPISATHLNILAAPDTNFSVAVPALSPDGRRVVYSAESKGRVQLYLRNLNEPDSHPLPGTEGATNSFWAPDSRHLAFFADGNLKKIDINGGPAINLCATGQARGGTWGRKDIIVFSPGPTRGLLRVPAAGGQPAPATELDTAQGEISHRMPWFLPDGRHFLYYVRNTDPQKLGVMVGDLESQEHRRVLTGLNSAIYASPGYLLYARDHVLMAQPFDAGRLQTTGEAVPVASHVVESLGTSSGLFGASESGSIVYLSGISADDSRLQWLDRTGKPLGNVGPAGGMLNVALSPDGARAAVDLQDAQTGTFDIWVIDLNLGVSSRLVANPSQDQYPIWSPDGNQVLFSSDRSGHYALYRKAAGGGGPEELLFDAPEFRAATDWSRDGRFVAFDSGGISRNAIWVLQDALMPARKPFPFLQSDFRQTLGRFSPDGRWLAYASNQNGVTEIFVQDFPGKQIQTQISMNGGNQPAWSRDGKELFFRTRENMLMVVDVRAGAKFEHGVSKPLFALPSIGGNETRKYDVSPDGKRILVIGHSESRRQLELNVMTNWFKR